MRILTHTHVVRRYTSRQSYEGWQVLLRRTYFLGVLIWSSEIDQEDVPVWATLQLACLGATDWQSKFADYME